MLVVPGTQLNSWQHASSENPQGGIQANVNGQFFTANGFLLDGTENQSAILGIAVINPNIDSLQDFKVSTSNYERRVRVSVAERWFRRPHRSGTNQFHGSLFEFLRNDIFNASDRFTGIRILPSDGTSSAAPSARPFVETTVRFFDYQGTRRRTGGSLITTVPTAAGRDGDLSPPARGLHLRRRHGFEFALRESLSLVPTTEGATTAGACRDGVQPSHRRPPGAGRRAYSQNGSPNHIPVAAPMAEAAGDFRFRTRSDIFNNYVSAGMSEAL